MIPFKETSERDRYEIMGTAKAGTMGTVTVAHPETATEAEASYDSIVETGQYQNVWVRHRHIIETIRNATPPGFSVFIKWVRDFDDEPASHDFLTRAAAMAFAEEGNDPAVMTGVTVYDHRQNKTVWTWDAKNGGVSW